MSDAIFPTLPGLKWESTKQPEFSTKIQTSASGKEARGAFWSYPRWTFKLSYEILRGANGYSELQTLMGFFLARQGSFDSFLYQDPSDCQVTGQQIGLGTGSQTQFQLCRTLGAFIEPVLAPNAISAIYINGTLQGSGWSLSNSNPGVIVFGSAPGNGSVVTADFSYYFRCRFLKDMIEFSQFMKDLWEAKKVEMVSLK